MRNLIVLVFGLLAVIGYSQDRKVVILNMTDINSETNLSRYYAVQQVLDVVGVPYDSTSDITTALNYPVVITGSRIVQDGFSSGERVLIENYVQSGGVLINSNLRDTNFRVLCGIDSIISNNDLYTITWDTTTFPQYCEMIDDSMEVTISLGRASSGPTFYSRTFTPSTGETIGYFENGKSALVHNSYGAGHVYTFGPDFRDLIYRTRINQDVNAHRVYSNGFEPSSDVIAFLLRNIIGEHMPNQVYKYPVPGNYSSVVCVTHDVDSRTAVDTLKAFVDAENNRSITAHYNITVRYLSDAWMSNFYVGAHQELAYIRDNGHTLASHSVGHFPDFADFPFGVMGNTTGSYQPVYFSGMTINGSVLGETEVSKDLLEDDFNVRVRSWRSGHLAYPDSLAIALEQLGYEFNSTYSSNDILTNFPYYAIHNGSFSGQPSGVLEIPMTISDVFASDPIDENNYMDKVGIWSDVNRRYDKNNSSLTLLIHPNRGWKLIAQEAFLDSLRPGQGVVAFEDYGEFWRKRDSLTYYTSLVNGGAELEVRMTNACGENQSFVIDTVGLTQVSFYDEFGMAMSFESKDFGGSKKLYFQNDLIVAETNSQVEDHHIQVFPNPSNGGVVVTAEPGCLIEQIEVYSIAGSRTRVGVEYELNKATLHFSEELPRGMYLINVKAQGQNFFRKVVLQ